MNPTEYANLERVEAEHWYYAGKRQFVKDWINRVRPPAENDVLLDCGAGTGRFAKEMEAYCRVLVLDDHEESLALLRARFRDDQIVGLADGEVSLQDGSLHYVTALDVLEHVPDDTAVVRGFHRLLRPGGLAVITVPASMALWSDWDESLHHYRRYHRAQLRALFPDKQWEIVHVNYTNVVVYPVVWLMRKWRRFSAYSTRSDTKAGRRGEDRIPPPWLNGCLRAVFVALSKMRVPFPFGVSLLLVASRRV